MVNFVGFVAELKQIYTEADSIENAYQQVIEEINNLKKHFDKNGLEFPKPISEQDFSGKLNFRLGKDLHKQVAEEAAKEGISINEYLIKKLSA